MADAEQDTIQLDKDMLDYFGGGDSTTTVPGQSLVQPESTPQDATRTDFGAAMQDVGDYAMSGDWLAPAIGVGAGYTAMKTVPTVAGAVAPFVPAAGRVKLKYELAAQAYEYGRQTADLVGFDEPRSRGIGGAAAFGGYKAGTFAIQKSSELIATAAARHIEANVGLGMHSEIIDQFNKNISKGVQDKLKGVKKKKARDAIMRKGEKAMSKFSDKTTRKLQKNMTKAGKKSWKQIAKKVGSDPKVAAQLGRFLQKKFPWVAAKLLASATAVAVPEAISSVIGVGGLLWAAYDVWDIMNTYPELGQQISRIVFGENTKESKLMKGMTSD
tara:strand:+ start:7436 stop:8419 length:984 start_codon:yes stop_codon:yes gene_type:complete